MQRGNFPIVRTCLKSKNANGNSDEYESRTNIMSVSWL